MDFTLSNNYNKKEERAQYPPSYVRGGAQKKRERTYVRSQGEEKNIEKERFAFLMARHTRLTPVRRHLAAMTAQSSSASRQPSSTA